MRATSYIVMVCAVVWVGVATPTRAAKGGGGAGGRSGPPSDSAPAMQNAPSSSSRSFATDHSWHHDHNHGFIVGGWWCDPWPYGYFGWGYPPPAYYDYSYPDYQFSPREPAPSVVGSGQGTNEVYQSGYLWGLDCRLKLATEKEARKMLKAYWPRASTEARADFQRGFTDGFGNGGDDTFDRLLNKALK